VVEGVLDSWAISWDVFDLSPVGGGFTVNLGSFYHTASAFVVVLLLPPFYKT
jgi:hypothetical protein